MTTEEALGRFLAEQNIIEAGCAQPDWYAGAWFTLWVRGRKIPFFPMTGFRDGLVQDDADHLVAGYGTSWKGEMELAGWELASGGCGANLVFWLDRLFFFPIGLLLAPIRTLRAFGRGLRRRNCYRLPTKTLLAMDIEELRRFVAA